jgi:hypothetical protein
MLSGRQLKQLVNCTGGPAFAGPQAVGFVRKSKQTDLEAATVARHRDLSGVEEEPVDRAVPLCD